MKSSNRYKLTGMFIGMGLSCMAGLLIYYFVDWDMSIALFGLTGPPVGWYWGGQYHKSITSEPVEDNNDCNLFI